MAATLVEGREYGLASNVSTGGNKTFIQFKLTDSALRALEEYSKIKGGCSRKPTIQFTGSYGIMCIPGQVSSEDPKAERSFQLNLTKIQGDANGSFDCIQQNSTGQDSSFQCLGSMQFKINTHANSDVYNDTRKKIAIADNESKKICAKEIKMSGRFSGKKIKKVIPSSHYKTIPTARPAPVGSSRPSVPSISTSASHSSLASSRLTPLSSSAHSPHHQIKGSGVIGKQISAVSSSNGLVKMGMHPGSKSSSGISSTPYNAKEIKVSSNFSDKMKNLMPSSQYKTSHTTKPIPVVPSRPSASSISASTSNSSLSSRLTPLSSAHSPHHPVNGSRTASKSASAVGSSNGVIKMNTQPGSRSHSDLGNTSYKNHHQQQQLESSRSAVSPVVSPAVQANNSPSPTRKHGSDDVTDLIPNKKQRISHHDRHQNHPNGRLPKEDLSTTNNHHSSDCTDSSKVNGFGVKNSPVAESPSSNRENQEKVDDLDSKLDYLTQYGSIENCEQRHRYKQDFNNEYEEYRRLHEKVQNVTRRFQHLKERILNTKEGSQEFEALRSKVLQEYEQQKSDSKFLQRKQRVDYLHGKLGHIKRLIMEYDRNHHITDCS